MTWFVRFYSSMPSRKGRRFARLAFLILTSVGVAVAELPAAVVFEQLPDPRIFPGTSSTLSLGGRPGRRSADDFNLSTDAEIIRVDWWGLHREFSSELDDFTFTFYDDAAGLPGNVLLETRATVTSVPDGTIATLVDYSGVLDTSFAGSANERYWVSIFNAAPDAIWQWNNSFGLNGRSVQSGLSPTSPWFEITGSGADVSVRLIAIPEPTTIPLALIGIVAAVRTRLRPSWRG